MNKLTRFIYALIIIVVFTMATAFGQDSWVRLQIQLDQWSNEASWTIYDSNGDVAFEMFDDYWDYPNQLIDLYMEMDSGDYTFEFIDSYGDGFYPSGYVLLTNECQDTLAYAFDLGNDTANGWTFPGVFDQSPAILLKSLTIAPCAPPATFTYGCVNPVAINYDSLATSSWMESCQYVYGCTNSNALNFDPNATYDDGSCTFPPPQFDTSNVYQNCNGSQTELTFEYQANGYGPTTNVNQIHYGYDLSATPFVQSQFFQGGVPVGATPPVTFPYTIWEATYFANTLNQIALKAGGNFVTEEIPHFFFVKFNDGTYSDTLWITPEACIVGCTDDTSPLYNPMATIDDGSCNVIAACGPNETNISIMVTPDSYPGETSWEIVDTLSENVIATSPNYNQTGIPVTTSICIDTTMALEFRLLDQFGDGLCGSCYGGVDGEVLVINPLCGDTIFYLAAPNTNFGYEIEQNFTLSFCPPPSPPSGCTNPGYVEFDPMAVVDDSSCVTPVILGCIDSTMFNYDSLANQQQIISGCNYTLKLTDGPGDGWFGSYIALVQGGNTYGPYTIYDGFVLDTVLSLSAMEPVKIYFYTQGNSITTANQCGIQLIDPFGNVTFDIGGSPWSPILTYPFKYTTLLDCGNNCIEKVYGCIDVLAVNYDSSANTADGSCYYNPGCMNPIYLEYNSTADYDDGSCATLIVLGCMDSTAYNYDSLANVELPGSCVPYVYGCMDPMMFNYDPLATAADTCIAYSYGCTDPTAFNFDPLANTDNGSCEPVVFGCIDSTAFNYNPLANTDNGSCEAFVYGCTDPSALNYNPLANVEDFSCIDFIYGCTDPTMFNYNPSANTDNGSCIPFAYGCTDSLAINYDILANTDDGSCIDVVLGCTDSTAFNYDILANTDDGSCIPVVWGCIDGTAFNFNPSANTDDGSCIPIIFGCIDPTMWNYCDTCNTDNGNCIPYYYGCTDSTALNYDDNANTDNGSCIYPLSGCTDATAINYNPLANVADSSCYYSAGCNVGDIYYIPNECFSWVIDVDNFCCDVEWDATCEYLYEYCVDGWSGPTDIQNLRNEFLNIYPNPTKGNLYFTKYVDVRIYNTIGELILDKKNVNSVSLQAASGLYNLIIKYQGIDIKAKIIINGTQ